VGFLQLVRANHAAGQFLQAREYQEYLKYFYKTRKGECELV